MKRTFKGKAKFSHLDPHMARFVVEPIRGVKAIGPVSLEPDMFPEDFELAEYDVSGSVEFVAEVKRKKK